MVTEDFNAAVSDILSCEIEEFTEPEPIDKGSEGVVFKGFHGKFGPNPVAFKKIHREISREIDNLIRCPKHMYIVELYGILCNSDKRVGFVMEYMKLGSLHRVIHESKVTYGTPEIIQWTGQIATGLKHLHQHKIIHRDIKPKNILMASMNHLKLADFGISRVIADINTSCVGTNGYMAPEVIDRKNYTFSADIFSLGITMWEITYQQHPHLSEKPLVMSPDKDEETAEIIKRCLSDDKERPSIDEIIEYTESRMSEFSSTISVVQSNETELGEQQTEIEGLIEDNRQMATRLTRLEEMVGTLQVAPPGRCCSPAIRERERQINPNKKLEQLCTVFCQFQNQINGQMSSLQHSFEKNITDLSSRVDRIESKVTKQSDQFSSLKTVCFSLPTEKKTILCMGRGEANETVILSSDKSKWIQLQLKLPHKLGGNGTAFLNGVVYIFGGYLHPKQLLKMAPNYEWEPLADMKSGRTAIANSSLVWKGSIWVFGGYNKERGEYLKSVERYDPKENKWIEMPDMIHPRSEAAAAVWDDKVIVCGGWFKTDRLRSMESYDLQTGRWTELSEMPHAVAGHSFVSRGNGLISLGGKDEKNNVSSLIWTMDPLAGHGVWKPFPQLGYSEFSSSALDDAIYSIGGYDKKTKSQLRRVQIYNEERWRDGPILPYNCRDPFALIISQELADFLPVQRQL